MPGADIAKFQFGLNGLFTKVNPEMLRDSQYRAVSSMEIVQEESLSSRTGRKQIGTMPATTLTAYMIQKMVVTPGEDPVTPATNPRYIGVKEGAGQDIYRTPDYVNYTLVASAVNSPTGADPKAFSLASYSAGEVGGSWAFIASELKMLKDSGASPYATLRTWGITPAFGVARAVTNGAGNLDGGASGSPNNTTAYDYRYCYQAADTNNRGNPSQTMLDDSTVANGVPLAVNLEQIRVTVQGGGDTTALPNISIYRRGGLLFDDWRLVGTVANPGAGATATYDDNLADVDLVNAPPIELDNDPPVTSTVASPIRGKLVGPTAVGRQTVTLASGNFAAVTVGSTLHFFYDSPEDVIVEAIGGGGTTITAYFQHVHINGADCEVDALVGQPVYLAIPFGQFVVVAGDPNSPHVLTASKGGRPESFPTTRLDGTVAQVQVGTPSNPIKNIKDFRGYILCLNLSSLFQTLIVQGSLLQPQQVANRGLVATRACCKTDNEVWFLSTDGVYSWDGSSVRKRTEAIDPLFHGRQIGSMVPLDYGSNVQSCVMEYRNGEVHLVYVDKLGTYRRIICEPGFNDRWRSYDIANPAITFIFTEPDTNSMVEARFNGTVVAISMYDQQIISAGANLTSDYFTTDPATQGNPIPWFCTLPWMDLGKPNIQKYFKEIWLDLATTGSSSNPAVANITVEVLLNFSDTAVDTITIDPNVAGRRLVSLVPQTVAGAPLKEYGREARAISFKISGNAYPARMFLNSLLVGFEEIGELTSGSPLDWSDLGFAWDKKLYQMTVEFDTAGTDRVLEMDIISGREGKTVSLTAQSFTLANPTTTGPGRAQKTFPIADGTIAKMIRLRPRPTTSGATAAATDFFHFKIVHIEKEDFPPDIVSFTPWDKGGIEYDKYCNQITLSVNTNNVAVTVKVQADGTDAGHTLHTFTVTSTESDRRRNITLPTGLIGKQWRLFVDPAQAALTSGAGVFQLFEVQGIFRFQPADKGEVGHTFDWDEIDHPWDKCLYTVTIEWDNTGGADVTMQLDILKGVNGQTLQSNVAQFVLANGRSRRNFPIPTGTIAKMIRIYPVGATIPSAFKDWKYFVEKEDFPPDIVSFTPWDKNGSDYDKYCNQIDLEVDTNNVAITVQVQADGATVHTMTITATQIDRRRNVTLPTGLRGKQWRLYVDPSQSAIVSGGGKFQLFSKYFAMQPADLGEVAHTFDWDDLGHPYDKRLHVADLEWDNTVGAGVTMTMDLLRGIDGGTLVPGIASFALGSNVGRSQKAFPLADGIICKKVRIYPIGGTIPVGFKGWKYKIKKEDFPPDIVYFTEPKDFEYPYDKIARNLVVKIDTGGVACAIQPVADGTNVGSPFSVTTTLDDWRRILPMAANLIGRLWKLRLTPGASGKAQLFEWDMEVIKEPAAVTRWSAYEQGFGYVGWKVIKQIWMEYICASEITLTIVSDTGTFTATLPVHSRRSSHRLYPGTVWGDGLNKSRLYDVSLAASTDFKLYSDVSGLEWLPLGSDRRSGYQKSLLSEFSTIPI